MKHHAPKVEARVNMPTKLAGVSLRVRPIESQRKQRSTMSSKQGARQSAGILPALYKEPQIQILRRKDVPAASIFDHEISKMEAKKGSMVSEGTGMERLPLAPQKADPTPLTEYTNSYLGIDIVLHQQKVKNALRGQSPAQLMTLHTEESGRQSQALLPTFTFGDEKQGDSQMEKYQPQRKAQEPTRYRYSTHEKVDSNYNSYRDSANQATRQHGNHARSYQSVGPTDPSRSVQTLPTTQQRYQGSSTLLYNSSTPLLPHQRALPSPKHPYTSQMTSSSLPTHVQPQRMPSNSAARRFQELQAKAEEREAKKVKETEKALQQYLKKTDPDAKFAMKMMKRLKRKQLQQEALSKGCIVLNQKQIHVQKKKMLKLEQRIHEEVQKKRKEEEEKGKGREKGDQKEEKQLDEQLNSLKDMISGRIKYVVEADNTERGQDEGAKWPEKSASSKLLNDLTERRDLNVSNAKCSTVNLQKNPSQTDAVEDRQTEEVSLANITDEKPIQLNQSLDELQMQLIKQGQVSTQKISQRSQEIIQESRELSLQNMDSKSEELGGAGAKNGDVVQVQPEVSSTVHIQDQSIVATASNMPPQHQKKSMDANYLENFEQLKGRFTHEASSGSESNKKEQASRSGKKIGEFKLNSNTQSEASPTNRPQSQNAGINLRTVFEQVKSRTEKLDDSYQMNSGAVQHKRSQLRSQRSSNGPRDHQYDNQGANIRVKKEELQNPSAINKLIMSQQAYSQGSKQDSDLRSRQCYQIITESKQPETADNRHNSSLFSMAQNNFKTQQYPYKSSDRSSPLPNNTTFNSEQENRDLKRRDEPQILQIKVNGEKAESERSYAALLDELPAETKQLFYTQYQKQFPNQKDEKDMMRSLSNLLEHEKSATANVPRQSRIQQVANARGPDYGRQLAKSLQKREVKVGKDDGEKTPVLGLQSKKSSIPSRCSSLKESQERAAYKKHSQHQTNLAQGLAKPSQTVMHTIKVKSNLTTMVQTQSKLAKQSTIPLAFDQNLKQSTKNEAAPESKFNLRNSQQVAKKPAQNAKSSKAQSTSPVRSLDSTAVKELARPKTQAGLTNMQKIRELIGTGGQANELQHQKNYQTSTDCFGGFKKSKARKAGLNLQNFQEQRLRRKNVENQKLFKLVQNKSMNNLGNRAVSPLLRSGVGDKDRVVAGPYNDKPKGNQFATSLASKGPPGQNVSKSSVFLPKSSIWSQQIKQVRLSQSRLGAEENFQCLVRNSYSSMQRAEVVTGASQTSDEDRAPKDLMEGEKATGQTTKQTLECEIPTPSITRFTATAKGLGVMNLQASNRPPISDKSISLYSNNKFVQNLKTTNESVNSLTQRQTNIQIHVENQKLFMNGQVAQDKRLNLLPLTLKSSLQHRGSVEGEQAVNTNSNRIRYSIEHIPSSNPNRETSSGPDDSAKRSSNYNKDEADNEKNQSPYISNINRQFLFNFGMAGTYQKPHYAERSQSGSKEQSQTRIREDSEEIQLPSIQKGFGTTPQSADQVELLAQVSQQHMDFQVVSSHQTPGEKSRGNLQVYREDNVSNEGNKDIVTEGQRSRRAVYSSGYELSRVAHKEKVDAGHAHYIDAPTDKLKTTVNESSKKPSDAELTNTVNETGMVNSDNLVAKGGLGDKKLIETRQYLANSMLSQNESYQISPHLQIANVKNEDGLNQLMQVSFAPDKEAEKEPDSKDNAESGDLNRREEQTSEILNIIYMKKDKQKPSSGSRRSLPSRSSGKRHNRITLQQKKLSIENRIRHGSIKSTQRPIGITTRQGEFQNRQKIQSSRGDHQSSNNDLDNIMTPMRRGGLPTKPSHETLIASRGTKSARDSSPIPQIQHISNDKQATPIASFHLMSQKISPDRSAQRKIDFQLNEANVYADNRELAHHATHQTAQKNYQTVLSSSDVVRTAEPRDQPPSQKPKPTNSKAMKKQSSLNFCFGVQSAQQRIQEYNRNKKELQATAEEQQTRKSFERKSDSRIRRGTTRNFGERLAQTLSQSQTRAYQADTSTLQNPSPKGLHLNSSAEKLVQDLQQRFTPIQIKNMKIISQQAPPPENKMKAIGVVAKEFSTSLPNESRRASTVSSNRAKVIMQVLQKRGYTTHPEFSATLGECHEREHSKDTLANDLQHVITHRNTNIQQYLSTQHDVNHTSKQLQNDQEIVQFQQLHQIQYPVIATILDSRNMATAKLQSNRNKSAPEDMPTHRKTMTEIAVGSKMPKLSRQAPLAPLIGNQVADRSAPLQMPVIVGYKQKLLFKGFKNQRDRSNRKTSSVVTDTEPLYSEQRISQRAKQLEVDEDVQTADRSAIRKEKQLQRELENQRQGALLNHHEDPTARIRILSDSRGMLIQQNPRNITITNGSKKNLAEKLQVRLKNADPILSIDDKRNADLGLQEYKIEETSKYTLDYMIQSGDQTDHQYKRDGAFQSQQRAPSSTKKMPDEESLLLSQQNQDGRPAEQMNGLMAALRGESSNSKKSKSRANSREKSQPGRKISARQSFNEQKSPAKQHHGHDQPAAQYFNNNRAPASFLQQQNANIHNQGLQPQVYKDAFGKRKSSRLSGRPSQDLVQTYSQERLETQNSLSTDTMPLQNNRYSIQVRIQQQQQQQAQRESRASETVELLGVVGKRMQKNEGRMSGFSEGKR